MKQVPYGRWLALAVLILVAGCFYSCSNEGRGEWLSRLQIEEQENEEEDQDSSENTSQKIVENPDIHESVAFQEIEVDSTFMKDTTPSCFVHVCGAVKKPGVYEMKEGQRVYEAVAVAGGFSEQAAQDFLNLAEPVWDGMKLEVPDQEQVSAIEWNAPIRPSGTVGNDGSSQGKVNLNTATKEELMTLRGIGEARAEDIIRYRQKQGGFECIEDIMEISGIKNAAFEKIKDDITV